MLRRSMPESIDCSRLGDWTSNAVLPKTEGVELATSGRTRTGASARRAGQRPNYALRSQPLYGSKHKLHRYAHFIHEGC